MRLSFSWTQEERTIFIFTVQGAAAQRFRRTDSRLLSGQHPRLLPESALSTPLPACPSPPSQISGPRRLHPSRSSPTNSLALPQNLFDVLPDLLIALGLHVHKDLLPRIWKQEEKGGRKLRTQQGTPWPQLVVIWDLLLEEKHFNGQINVYVTHYAAFFLYFFRCEHINFRYVQKHTYYFK